MSSKLLLLLVGLFISVLTLLNFYETRKNNTPSLKIIDNHNNIVIKTTSIPNLRRSIKGIVDWSNKYKINTISLKLTDIPVEHLVSYSWEYNNKTEIFLSFTREYIRNELVISMFLNTELTKKTGTNMSTLNKFIEKILYSIIATEVVKNNTVFESYNVNNETPNLDIVSTDLLSNSFLTLTYEK